MSQYPQYPSSNPGNQPEGFMDYQGQGRFGESYEPIMFTSQAAQSLFRSRGWISFLAIMCYIGAGFCLLFSLLVLAAPKDKHNEGAMIAVALVTYLVMGVLSLVFGILLSRFAGAIGRLRQTGHITHLEGAMESQRVYWRALGIMTIVMISLQVCGVGAGIIIAMSRR